MIRVEIKLTDEQVAQILEMATLEAHSAENISHEDMLKTLTGTLNDASPDSFAAMMANQLISMVRASEDSSWGMPETERQLIDVSALYFIICNQEPDKATRRLKLIKAYIVAKLVAEEEKHELEAYSDYLEYKATTKDTVVDRDSWLRMRTQEILDRMSMRRNRMRGDGVAFLFSRTGSTGPRGNEDN